MTLDELRATAEPGRGGYRVFGGEYAQMSVTLEDAEFLYALVRLMKPLVVLELGTGLGVSGKFIAEALPDDGLLATVEPDPAFWSAAEEMLADLPVAFSWRGDMTPQPDLVFIDSGYDRREGDIETWIGGGTAYAGLAVVHDANRDYEALRGRGVLIPGTDGMWVGRGGEA